MILTAGDDVDVRNVHCFCYCVQMAEHVAQQGYRVLVPDLYRGQVALTTMEAMHVSQTQQYIQHIQYIQYIQNTAILHMNCTELRSSSLNTFHSLSMTCTASCPC